MKNVKIGDTIRTISGDEFIVAYVETDKEDIQYVSEHSKEAMDALGEDIYFHPMGYLVPDCNFEIIKKAE